MGKVIGITTRIAKSSTIKEYKDNHLEGINLLNVSSDYSNAISDSGGIPMLIPILETYDKKTIEGIIKSIDGLLLTGGEDIHPRLYTKENSSTKVHELMKRDLERDTFELALLKAAYNVEMPILGICRGHQLINVCFGGSLIDDIEKDLNTSITHLSSLEDKCQLIHSVHLKKDSLLNKVYESQELLVNSFHHQCIDKLSSTFEVIAKSEDEIIEGISHKGPEWILGVQWHPEMLYKKYEKHIKLFQKFIKVVHKKAENL